MRVEDGRKVNNKNHNNRTRALGLARQENNNNNNNNNVAQVSWVSSRPHCAVLPPRVESKSV